MAERKTLTIVDFDDTLFFTGRCIENASKKITGRRMGRRAVRKLPKALKAKVYALAFSKYSHNSIPNLRLHKILSRAKGPVYVLSARLNGNKAKMLDLMRQHGVQADRIITRKDASKKDEEWKLLIFKKMAKRNQRIIAYEDKRDNIAYIKERMGKSSPTFYLVSPNAVKRFPM